MSSTSARAATRMLPSPCADPARVPNVPRAGWCGICSTLRTRLCSVVGFRLFFGEGLMSEGYTVAVVGAGLVGDRLVAELRRREFPLRELRILARSARTAVLAGETFEVGVAEPEAFEGVDIAFFAGTEGEKGAALQLAQEAIARGAIVIDTG